MGRGQGSGKGKGGVNCCIGSAIAPDGKVPPPDPANADRGCTDIIFFLIVSITVNLMGWQWVAFLVGMGVCAYLGFSKGDLDELFYFIDYQGNKCGKNGLGKYTYFTHPTNTFSNICLDSCPSALADANGQVSCLT